MKNLRQELLKENICDAKTLKEFLPLTEEDAIRMEENIRKHPEYVTKYYLSLIDKNNANDPIRKMCIPDIYEISNAEGKGSKEDLLINSNQSVMKHLQSLCEKPDIDYVCIETRIPVVLPQRIIEDDELLRTLEYYVEKKQIIIITQFNHPRELTPNAIKAVKMLTYLGCIVRNQTVLLKGINDTPETLSELMNKLVASGAIPCYIFQCRPFEGVKNQFQVPLYRGIDIFENAKKKLNDQAKSVRFIMPHPTGKIEILGKLSDGRMLFKYHQAKYDEDQFRMFAVDIENTQCWLD